MAANTSSRFIISIGLVNDPIGRTRFRKAGFATLGDRVSLDVDALRTFPRGTRSNEQIRKACRWLADESAAQSVDVTLPRGIVSRVIKL